MHGLRWDACTQSYRRPLVLFASPLVRSSIKRDEQNKVGAQSRASGEGRKLLTCASPNMGNVGEELVSIVIVRGEIHETYFRHQLQPRKGDRGIQLENGTNRGR